MPARSALVSTSIFLFGITIVFSMVLSLSFSWASFSACRLCVLLRRWSPGWLGGLALLLFASSSWSCRCLSWLRALVSWLLAIRVLDIVCLGPVSLPPFGFCIAGLLDVVCLGPVSRFPCFRPFGLPDVVYLWTYLCLSDFFLPLG